MFGLFVLFSAKICRNLSPFFGFPFQNTGGVCVFPKPFLRTFYQFEQFLCFCGTRKLGLTFLLPHPADCIDAVTVDGHIESLLFQQSQSVYDSEEFADIIRSLRRAKVEDFLAAGYVDSAIFHRTGVAAAGSVHRQTVVNHAGGQCFRRNFLAFLLGIFSDIGVRGGGQCAFRFFAGVE